MNRLRVMSGICLCVIVASVAIMAWCMYGMYRSVRKDVMRTVAECVARADVMELITRMEPPAGRSDEAAVRIGSYIAMVQQNSFIPLASDTLNTSFAELLRFGLDFPEGREKTDYNALDSLFRRELSRSGLRPEQAFILPAKQAINDAGYWTLEYRVSPSSAVSCVAYITPLDGHILRRMWVMIAACGALVVAIGSIVTYLLVTVKRMRTLEQMKDDFTHNMTHELKTPVAVAMSAADSMLRYYDPADEERNRRMLEIILGRLGFLSGIIEKILSVSMERFRHLELHRSSVEVRTTIDNVAKQILLKSGKPTDISVNVVPDDLMVTADPLHFSNIVSNLLDNAVKYSGSTVKIEVNATHHGLVVRDNGLGIEETDIRHIFDKFYRVTHDDRYEVQGFGLGLYYVRQVVEQMGWHISTRSARGKGSEFIIVWEDEKR